MKKYVILLFVVLLGLAWFSAGSDMVNDPIKAKEHMEKAAELEEKGIYVSSGSACSSNHPAISGTLKAIGVDKKYLDATVRFSFCYDTTKEEIHESINALEQIVPMLRRYTPGGRR